MSGFNAVEKKVSRPPGAQNCARLNVIGDELATTKLIANFAVSIPPFNYLPAMKQCQTHVQLGLELDTAVNAVLCSGAPAGRGQNASFVEAFFRYDECRGYSLARCVESYNGEFRLSRDIRVPTKPTFTILENGNLIPVSLCGWKSISLDRSQIRFWMTMLEEGLYSHTDYRRSPAEVVFFLEQQTETGPVRIPYIIKRGDYSLFSPNEMREQAELYVRAQSAALPIARALWEDRERKRKERDRTIIRSEDKPDFREPGLFD
ncbi:hypothetical protein [Sphingomonas sp. GB1N7]|uniref:hypothetical protein n=1 Tax=Parasphingomonas caseinilytica TaxID=3096158 RepID=UPI002FC859A7